MLANQGAWIDVNGVIGRCYFCGEENQDRISLPMTWMLLLVKSINRNYWSLKTPFFVSFQISLPDPSIPTSAWLPFQSSLRQNLIEFSNKPQSKYQYRKSTLIPPCQPLGWIPTLFIPHTIGHRRKLKWHTEFTTELLMFEFKCFR